MSVLRRRFARMIENIIAFAVGAVIVCLINGMSPVEIAELAWANAHVIPEKLPEFVAEAFATGFLS